MALLMTMDQIRHNICSGWRLIYTPSFRYPRPFPRVELSILVAFSLLKLALPVELLQGKLALVKYIPIVTIYE